MAAGDVLVINSIIVLYLVQVLVRGRGGPPKAAALAAHRGCSMKIAPLGDSAVVVTLGETLDAATAAAVQALAAALEAKPLPGLIECAAGERERHRLL